MAALDQIGLLPSLFEGAIGAGVGSFISYLGVLKYIQSKYNTELHKERISAYGEIWEAFEPFADYSKQRNMMKSMTKNKKKGKGRGRL